MEIECNIDRPPHKVMMDYVYLLVQSCFCLSLAHQVRECGKCKWGHKENGKSRWIEQEGTNWNGEDHDGLIRVEGREDCGME